MNSPWALMLTLVTWKLCADAHCRQQTARAIAEILTCRRSAVRVMKFSPSGKDHRVPAPLTGVQCMFGLAAGPPWAVSQCVLFPVTVWQAYEGNGTLVCHHATDEVRVRWDGENPKCRGARRPPLRPLC